MTRTPSRPDPRDDADIEHEGSSVRPRVTPPIDELVRAGKVLLADLPADHPRASLLRVAVWRRDAALLRALIDEFRAWGREPRATLLPPPRSR